MEERKLQWASPTVKFPLLEALTRAFDYLRILLSSKDHTQWLSLCQKLTEPQGPDYSIAPRWPTMMGQDLGSIPTKPSPLVVYSATKQLSIERSLSQRDATCAAAKDSQRACIMLNFPIKGKTGAPRRRAAVKCRRATTIEHLRVCDAPGDKATIQ